LITNITAKFNMKTIRAVFVEFFMDVNFLVTFSMQMSDKSLEILKCVLRFSR